MDTKEYLVKKFNAGENEIHGINRTIMAQTLGELGFKVGAEVGVAEGHHAKVLLDNNRNLFLNLVDAWKHYPGYDEYEDLDLVYQKCDEVTKPYSSRIFIHRSLSMDAIRDFPDNSLDFVYLDSAHDFKNVAMDIYEWSKKVRKGGIVFGHDYKHHRAYMEKDKQRYPVHVRDVVDAYIRAFEIKDFYILTNDIRDPNFGRDNPGWMYIK